METVTTDQGTFEYVGEFHYEDGTVHRYRRIDTPEEEKEEIIMGIKKICLQYQLRKQKEAEEQRILDERIRKSQLECQKYKLENERAVIDNQRLKIIAHTTLFVAAVFVAGAVSVIVTLAEYGVI